MTAISLFWPPMLSEQWATTYLQILFGLMVFALGVPTLAYELVVQEDVRHVAQRHGLRIRIWLVVIALLFVGSITFIWVFHPPLQETWEANARQTNPTAAWPQTSASPAATAQTQAPQGNSAASPTPGQPEASPRDVPTSGAAQSNIYMMSIEAAGIVTVVPTLSFALGFLVVFKLRRKQVIERLTKELRPTGTDNLNLNELALDDLIYLGTHGKAGHQKEFVLKMVDELAVYVQACKGYGGYELDKLLRGLETILCHPERPGNDENFESAVNILKGAWRRLSGSGQNLPSDSIATLETLRRLALYALTKHSEKTAILFLEEAAVCDSDIVFEIGLAAIQAKKFFIAADALVKLEGLLRPPDATATNHAHDTEEDVKGNLLGLIAHFAAAGRSAQRQAQLTLNNNREHFTPNLQDALTEACQHHYDLGRYETADHILALADSLAPVPPVQPVA